MSLLKVKKFKEDFTAKFYKASPASIVNYRISLEKILSLARIKKGESVIDLGCGTGDLLAECLKFTRKAVGVDNSRYMISQGKKDNPGVEFIFGDTLDLKMKNEKFDLALSRAVFQHLTKKQHKKFLQEVNRILRPGGRFIFFTPIDSIPMRIPRFISKIIVKERRKFSGTLYSDSYIKSTIKRAGFSLEKVEYYGLFFYVLSGYGTEFYLPFHKDRKLWEKLLMVDDLLMRVPGMKFFALNGIYKAVKRI